MRKNSLNMVYLNIMRMPSLELKSVTKRFGNSTAVNRLSLKLETGEVFGLIGPNGSGKTTTLKMVCGLYRATRGSIRVSGFDVLKSSYKSKWHIGYVPDEPVAYDKLTGREFLEFVGELYGIDREARNERIDELLDAYDLARLADGYFGKYSRGTKQKITIIAALMQEPSLLLIDEPAVGLDPASIEVTKSLIRDYARDGGTALISTRTLPLAEELCTRFGILQKGVLKEVGTLQELRHKAGLKRGSLERVFLELT